MSSVVETFGLSKIYVRDFIGTEYGRVKVRLRDRKVPALLDLNLEVEEGEIFGLLGPNGAGKTTCLKILVGLIFPTRGSARILGYPLGDRRLRRTIGFLPENPYFYDYLKGWEFLDYYGQLYGMGARERRKRLFELLELVGLSEAANLPLKGYSKGMLQRIGVAQALLNDPQLVILDEPQSGLDPFGRKEVRDIILQLKEAGKTVFFSSHILSDAEMICNRVGILNRGQLINVGYLSELLSTRIEDYELIVRGLNAERVSEFEKMATKLVRRKDDVIILLDSEEKARRVLSRVLSDPSAHLISYLPRQETLEHYFIRQIKEGAQ